MVDKAGEGGYICCVKSIEGLKALGLTQHEARVYAALLEVKTAKVSELVELSKMHRPHVYAALGRLMKKGFVNGNEGKVGIYTAAPPELAFTESVEQTRDLLSAQMEAIKLLEGAYASRADGNSPPSLIEVLRATPSEPSPGFADRLQSTSKAKKEILFLTRRHLRSARSRVLERLVEQNLRVESEALQRGVVCRCVYQASFLDDPASRQSARVAYEAGELSRVVEHIPVGAIIIDRQFVWLRPDSAEAGIAYKVNDTCLGELFAQAFESYWAQGVDAAGYLYETGTADRVAGNDDGRGKSKQRKPGNRGHVLAGVRKQKKH